MQPIRSLSVWILAVLCVSGCAKLAQFDAQSEEVAALKMQVTLLQNLTDGMSKDIANLNSQMVFAVNRISELEAARRKDPAEPHALSREQSQAVETAVASCVKQVHESAPEQSYEKTFWTGFDAYFVAATGKVRDNVVVNGQRPAKYAFDKCMASKGIPLS